MNCQEFWDNIPDMGAGADQLRHAGECPACAELLSRHRALEAGLKAVAAEMRQVEAPARVESGLVAAFRLQNQVVRRTDRSQWWVPALSWAAAAAILVVAALAVLHPRQPMPAHRGAPNMVESAALTESVDTNALDGEDGFIPLPNTQRLDPNEDVNVVRVEVPRSAMMAVGLAVSADSVSELVEADVMLGQDGVARAIRFVDE
jgi:hypothetical protein